MARLPGVILLMCSCCANLSMGEEEVSSNLARDTDSRLFSRSKYFAISCPSEFRGNKKDHCTAAVGFEYNRRLRARCYNITPNFFRE